MNSMKEYSKKCLQSIFGGVDGIRCSKNFRLPDNFDVCLEKIRDMPVRKEDVWIINYPRTGSRLCQEIVWLIGNDLDFGTAEKTKLQLRIPLLEMSIVYSEFATPFSNVFENSMDYVMNLPDRRFIKSHLPLRLLPKRMNEVKPKVIYTMRNIKDLCVSYFHHAKLTHGSDMPVDQFCELFLKHSVASGGIFDHYLEFSKKHNELNILILKYEEVEEDTEGTIRKIAAFLDKSLTTEQIVKLKEFLNLQLKMNDNFCEFEPFLECTTDGKNFDKIFQQSMVKTQVGVWKNHISSEMSLKFDEYLEKYTKEHSVSNMVISDNNDDLEEILERDFTTVFRPGYINVDGVTMPQRFGEMKQEILDFDVKEHDVWVCSFPKTGTTWTQEMIWMLMNNLDFDGCQVNLGARSPFLEVTALFDYRKFRKEFPEFEPPPFIEDSLGFVRQASKNGPICLKTHLPWNLLPKQIQDNEKKPKIIYVTRNPKDTCVSYFNHSRLMEGFRGTFENFCKLFLHGKLNFAPYWNHVLPFWQRRHQDNILFITYEDLKKDLPKVIRQVAEFLGKPLSDEKVSILSTHLNFDNMKNNPAVNFELIVSLNRKYNLINCEGEFMRSGKVGDYKAKMNSEIIKLFDEWTKENTLNSGFDLYSE